MKQLFLTFAILVVAVSAQAQTWHTADQKTVSWDAADGAVSYNLFLKPVKGGDPMAAPAWGATYAAHPGDYTGAKIYGAAPDIGAIEYHDHTFGGWFFEFFIPTIFNLCASTNANCYTQP